MRFSKRAWLLTGAGVFALVSIAGVEITSKSFFCGSACHIMKPYHESWKSSTHKDVECVRCHIAPGTANYVEAKLNGLGQVVDDVLDRTSTKPSASVEDFACQRSGCHGPAAGGNLDPTEARAYRFKHEKHLHLTHLGIEIHCATCHSHVRGDEHFVVNTNVCVTCHLVARAPDPPGLIGSGTMEMATIAFEVRRASEEPELAGDPADAEAQSGEPGPRDGPLVAPAGCESCHEAPRKPFEYRGQLVDHREYLQYGTRCDSCHRSATAPPDPVKDAACLSCHAFGIDHTLATEEIHRLHAEGKHKVECFSCHGVTDHGVIADSMALRQLDCASCHSGQHQVQVATFSSMEEDVSDEAASMVSPMFLSHVGCNACHVERTPLDEDAPARGSFLAATADACDECHKEGTGEEMITMWQRDTRALFDRAAALLEGLDSDAELSPEARRLRDQARELLDLVRVDGSWGVHNPRYTAHLMEVAIGNLLEAQRVSGASGPEGATP